MLDHESILHADRVRQRLLEGGLNKDFKRVKKQQNQQRKLAEEERESENDKKGSKPTFLRPSDIAGDYDYARALRTTLGMPEGQTRPLTQADLKAFAANIEQMASAYKGGISVDQVLNLSTQDRIDRANKQIFSCVPVGRKNGVVHFATNASRESKVSIHHVHVEFLAFNELVFHPDRIKSTTVRNRLAKGRVKFECDCEDFKYVYRYLNTVAGVVLGRKEGGFPKIRNPNLVGVACKHLLRVMHWVKSTQGQQYLAQQLEKERTTQVGRRNTTPKHQMTRMLAEQIVRANTKRHEIKGNLNAEVARLERKAKQQAQALARRQKELLTKNQAMVKIRSLLEAGVLTQAEFDILSKKL